MRSRPITEADVPALVALMNKATPERPTDEAEVRGWFSVPLLDVASNFRLFEDAGGRPIAYADLIAPSERPDLTWSDIRIPPRYLSEETVEPVLKWVEGRTRELGRSAVRASTPSSSLLGPLLAGHGYRTIRHFFRMRIDLDGPLPAPVWPEQIAVRTAEPGEERAVYEASEDSFVDHWDYVRGTYDEWAAYQIDDRYDPSLWFLAVAGDEIAGISLCRNHHPGEPDVGWVSILGVRRSWRRRGVARALLLHSFGELERRGRKAVCLGVDAENVTGAVGLYQQVGMHVQNRGDSYERRLE